MSNPYRLTLVRRFIGESTKQESILLVVDNDDEAIGLAKVYIASLAPESLKSATIAAPSGAVVWENGSVERENRDHGVLQSGGGSA